MHTRIFTSCLPLHQPSTAVDGTGSQIEQRSSKYGKNQDLRIQSKEVQCDASYFWQSQNPWPSYTRIFSAVRRRLRNTKTAPENGSLRSCCLHTRAKPSMPLRKSTA